MLLELLPLGLFIAAAILSTLGSLDAYGMGTRLDRTMLKVTVAVWLASFVAFLVLAVTAT